MIVDENSPVKCYWSPPDNTAVMLDQDGNNKVADDLAEEDGFIVALWACGANKWWKWSSEVPLLEFMESLGEEEPVPKPKKSRAVSKRPVLKRPMLKRPMHACMKRPAGKVTKVKWSGFSESLNIPKKKNEIMDLFAQTIIELEIKNFTEDEANNIVRSRVYHRMETKMQEVGIDMKLRAPITNEILETVW